MNDEDSLILAIDFGTQSVRASLFNKKGAIIAMEKKEYNPPYHSSKPGEAEQDPDAFYLYMCQCTKALVLSYPELMERVQGMTVTCFRDSAVLLDKDRRVVRPTILWLDQRFAKCEDKLPFISRVLFHLVGMTDAINMNRRRTIANWVKENEPENWKKVDKYIPISTYFIYRMTGQLKDTASDCTGHYPIDFKHGDWYKHPEKNLKGQIFSLTRDQLCDIVLPGSLIGEITERGARETGLPKGLKLYAAGSDKSCESLGVGVTDSRIASVSLGTACSFSTTITKYIEPFPFLPAYASCLKGRYNLEMQVYRGLWMINWFLKEFGATRINDLVLDNYLPEDFSKEVMKIPAGSDGLILQPYWGPMLDRPAVKGAIIGFSDSTTRTHFYKAIIEGLGYAMREAMERFEKKVGHKFSEIRISGGGASSPEVCQIMADIFGLPVVKVQTIETSSLGAAITGFLAIGTYKTPEEAVQAMVKPQETFQPNAENHKIYDSLFYNVYLKMYPSLKKSYAYLWQQTRN